MTKFQVNITYHRQRSSTARVRNGAIHLRISNLVSRREQQRHIDELLKKMEVVAERYESKEKLSFMALLEPLSFGSSDVVKLVLSTGVVYQVKIKKGKNKNSKIQKIGDVLWFIWPVERKFDIQLAEELLWKFLAKDQVIALEYRLNCLREGWIREEFSTVRMRQVMTRWGSCDKKRGVIMLSLKLLIMPEKLLDYVCVHELAHLKYADHSDLFWNLVSKKMPDWNVQRKRLRHYE